MKIDIAGLIEFVIDEAEKRCQIKTGGLDDSSSRLPQCVEARRLVVMVLRPKLGFRPGKVQKALNLKGPINNLQKVAMETYGKDDEVGKGFTEAVDEIVEKVVVAYGKIEDIRAAATGKGEKRATDSEQSGQSGPKRKGKKPGRQPSKGQKHREATGSVLPATVVLYAFSQVDGLSAEDLAECFEMAVSDVEREFGKAFFALRRDSPTINRGIERIRKILATKQLAKK